MNTFGKVTALHLRYDGLIPANASIPADADEPLAVQYRNRRDLAWKEVRRLGHELAQESRAFARDTQRRASGSLAARAEDTAVRASLMALVARPDNAAESVTP